MNTAVAYAPNRYHCVQMNTESLNYALSKGCACSSLKGFSLNCITFRTATDMLFRDDLTKKDIKKLKEVAIELLKNIKAKISELDHWPDKQETKAEVDNLIRDILWRELPECYDEISISSYRQHIYGYVYTRYGMIA